VATIALDAVLTELPRVRLLKIDAEGAEYPILLTSTRLSQVDTIIGEYHEFSEGDMTRLAPDARVGEVPYTYGVLARALSDHGFLVERRSASGESRNGLFAAVRQCAQGRA
jgi:hypothetical protein